MEDGSGVVCGAVVELSLGAGLGGFGQVLGCKQEIPYI